MIENKLNVYIYDRNWTFEKEKKGWYMIKKDPKAMP